MGKTVLQVIVGLIAAAAALFFMVPDKKVSSLPELLNVPDFIPSLYSHNHGDRDDIHSGNQYRALLKPFCDGRDFSQALPGSMSEQDYATTIYNLSYEKYKEKTDFFNDQIDWLLDCARKTGKLRVIINYDFYSSSNQKKALCETTSRIPSDSSGCPNQPDGSPGYVAANVSDAMLAFNFLFSERGPKNLDYTFLESNLSVVAGFSLGEENSTWDYRRSTQSGEVSYVFEKQMRSNFLNALYDELKQKHGLNSRRFLQWYSPHKTVINFPGSGENWPLINADGWVFDQYPMKVVGDQRSVENGNYYKFVNAMRQLDKPLYSIIWASPLRFPSGSGLGRLNFDWWDSDLYEGRDGGWKSLHGQLAVNQKFNVPTLFYILTPDATGAVRHDVFMTQSGLPYKCGLGLYDQLMKTTFPFVKANNIPLELSVSRPEWIVSSPKNCD